MKRIAHVIALCAFFMFDITGAANKIKQTKKTNVAPTSKEFVCKEIKGIAAFEKALSSGKSLIIEFYTPWCGFCKSMEKPFKSVAKKYGSQLTYLKINADLEENKPIVERFNVTAFPTIVTQIVLIEPGSMTEEELDNLSTQVLEMTGKKAPAPQEVPQKAPAPKKAKAKKEKPQI
jgi:thiol-disulfide isomerase/thioredoxin